MALILFARLTQHHGANLPCSFVSICQSIHLSTCVCMYARLCWTPCHSMDCSPPGSFVYGIFQGRILEQVAISYQRDLPDPGIEPASPALAGEFFTTSTTWEAHLHMTIS